MAIMIPNDIYYGRRKELQEKSVRKSESITGTLLFLCSRLHITGRSSEA